MLKCIFDLGFYSADASPYETFKIYYNMFRKTEFKRRYSGDRPSSSNRPKPPTAKPPTAKPPTAKPLPVDPHTGLNIEQVGVLDKAASQVRATINPQTAARRGPIRGLPKSDQGVAPVRPNRKKGSKAPLKSCFGVKPK